MPWEPLPEGRALIPDKGNTFIDPQIYGGNISGSTLDSVTITNATIPWAAWSPSYANITVGNGAVIARYIQIGSLVVARFRFALGTTSAIGTAPTISLPVTASGTGYGANGPAVGPLTCRDAGTTLHTGGVFIGSSTVFNIFVDNSTGTYGAMSVISATIPMTWTTTDELSFTATYEAA